MKILFPLFFLFSVVSAIAQTTTYSKEEERMVQYVNNGLAYAMKYDSLQNVKPVIDSCWIFLKKYPVSFAKPNVFSYMLEMTAVISKDLRKINPLIDSVLYYDKLPGTKLRIGEILITRNLDLLRGRKYIMEAFPKLTVQYHIFNSYMLMAKSDVALGHYASARMNFEKALKIDSTRAQGWYEYLAFLKAREFSKDAKKVLLKIELLDKEDKLKYIEASIISPNINKNIYKNKFKLTDLSGVKLAINSYRGKVLVINRFNFWCGYCVLEFPALKKMIREFPEVEFIFVNYGETPDELRMRYFKKKEFSFLKNQIILYGTKEFDQDIYGLGVPQTIVVDKSGNVRYDYSGYRKELEKLLRNNLRKLTTE